MGKRPTLVRVMTLLISLVGACGVTATIAQQTRYVVANKVAGIEFKVHPLWASKQFADSCAKALMYGTEENQKMFCETGFSGLKPKLGVLHIGTVVELMDSRECGDMAYIHVLTGKLKGETGCTPASALSSVRP